jgi:hypothetical protein
MASSLSLSSLEKTAMPYEEEEKILKSKARNFWDNLCFGNGFSSYSEVDVWEVFVFRIHGLGHFSLAFKNENHKYFCVDLIVTESDLQKVMKITYNFKVIDVHDKKYNKIKQLSLGIITKSAEEILHTGYTVLKNFGEYRALTNNCQDYCCKLAEELECEKTFSRIVMNLEEILVVDEYSFMYYKFTS